MTIPNYKCDCGATNQFDSAKSSTYKPTNYSFSSGASTGFFGQDIVRFGSIGTDQLAIRNALFAQIVSDPRFGDNSVMGLGFSSNNPEKVDSPIVTAVESGILDHPVVTIFMRKPYSTSTNNGVITYGAVDKVNCDHNVVYEPLTNSTSFQIAIKKAAFGSQEFSGDWTARIASTNTYLRGPKTVVNALAKEVQAVYDNVDGVYIVNCGAKLNLNLTIGTTVYSLTESTLIMGYYDNTCVFRILPASDDTWTLGVTWFQSFCTVLDYKNKKTGFSKIIT